MKYAAVSVTMSHYFNPGKADAGVTGTNDDIRKEGFSSLTTDARGNVWIAFINRPEAGNSHIAVYVQDGTSRIEKHTISPDNHTGLGPPRISEWNTNGICVVFSYEENSVWRIGFCFLQIGSTSPLVHTVSVKGSSNINPVVATSGQTGWILWESNATEKKTIYGCSISGNGAGNATPISSDSYNSYNPSIVALGDGSYYAAWDSVRNQSADIFGCRCTNGAWDSETRLTSDPRIERHPSLATWKNELWMCWQAQSYTGLQLNDVDEQLIAVARIDGGKHDAPQGLISQLGESNYYLRPRIQFDPFGQLWLSARKCEKTQGNWYPMAFCYADGAWDTFQISKEQGLWYGIDLCFVSEGTAGAIQGDNIPTGWTQRGKHPGWDSTIKYIVVSTNKPSGEVTRPTESLTLPSTEFSLHQKMDVCAADLPKQEIEYENGKLQLFWGDLHSHSTLSVCVRKKNPPLHDIVSNERDIEKLDFCAITDHGYNFDNARWDYYGDESRAHHDPGRFVLFPAQEWTSDRTGHRNIIYKKYYDETFYDAYDGNIRPDTVWKQIAEHGHDFIFIPHQISDHQYNVETDWSITDEYLQPLAEMYQTRGSYEYLGCPRQASRGTKKPGHYIQDVWAKGIIIGAMASPDHGGGDGKIGVWAEKCDNDSLFQAFRSRHTFGTSGPKMALCLRSGDHLMGDKCPLPPGSIPFVITALALRPIKDIVLFRNNTIIYQNTPGEKKTDLSFTDKEVPAGEDTLWYYARIQTEDDHLAWSSPIWFIRNFVAQNAKTQKSEYQYRQSVTCHNYILSIIVPNATRYKISTFDLKGRIIDTWDKSGSQRIFLSRKKYSKGKYFYKITSPRYSAIYGEFSAGLH